jgi:molybdopterin-guanine dinucleotide biosynthesis protein A
MKIAAAILAGGRATRMGGADKALLEVGGARIVDRQVAALAPLVAEVLLVGGADRAVAGARLVPDLQAGRGPLAGIEAAFVACDADALLVLGCDLPFLDEKLLRLIRDHAPEKLACVPRVEGRAQALHARYSRAILPIVERRLHQNQLRLLALLDELDVAWLDLPASEGLTNVNTPDQLAEVRARFRS